MADVTATATHRRWRRVQLGENDARACDQQTERLKVFMKLALSSFMTRLTGLQYGCIFEGQWLLDPNVRRSRRLCRPAIGSNPDSSEIRLASAFAAQRNAKKKRLVVPMFSALQQLPPSSHLALRTFPQPCFQLGEPATACYCSCMGAPLRVCLALAAESHCSFSGGMGSENPHKRSRSSRHDWSKYTFYLVFIGQNKNPARAENSPLPTWIRSVTLPTRRGGRPFSLYMYV